MLGRGSRVNLEQRKKDTIVLVDGQSAGASGRLPMNKRRPSSEQYFDVVHNPSDLSKSTRGSSSWAGSGTTRSNYRIQQNGTPSTASTRRSSPSAATKSLRASRSRDLSETSSDLSRDDERHDRTSSLSRAASMILPSARIVHTSILRKTIVDNESAELDNDSASLSNEEARNDNSRHKSRSKECNDSPRRASSSGRQMSSRRASSTGQSPRGLGSLEDDVGTEHTSVKKSTKQSSSRQTPPNRIHRKHETKNDRYGDAHEEEEENSGSDTSANDDYSSETPKGSKSKQESTKISKQTPETSTLSVDGAASELIYFFSEFGSLRASEFLAKDAIKDFLLMEKSRSNEFQAAKSAAMKEIDDKIHPGERKKRTDFARKERKKTMAIDDEDVSTDDELTGYVRDVSDRPTHSSEPLDENSDEAGSEPEESSIIDKISYESTSMRDFEEPVEPSRPVHAPRMQSPRRGLAENERRMDASLLPSIQEEDKDSRAEGRPASPGGSSKGNGVIYASTKASKGAVYTLNPASAKQRKNRLGGIFGFRSFRRSVPTGTDRTQNADSITTNESIVAGRKLARQPGPAKVDENSGTHTKLYQQDNLPKGVFQSSEASVDEGSWIFEEESEAEPPKIDDANFAKDNNNEKSRGLSRNNERRSWLSETSSNGMSSIGVSVDESMPTVEAIILDDGSLSRRKSAQDDEDDEDDEDDDDDDDDEDDDEDNEDEDNEDDSDGDEFGEEDRIRVVNEAEDQVAAESDEEEEEEEEQSEQEKDNASQSSESNKNEESSGNGNREDYKGDANSNILNDGWRKAVELMGFAKEPTKYDEDELSELTPIKSSSFDFSAIPWQYKANKNKSSKKTSRAFHR
ncbi:hypothetical protein ACA910_008787 [Epithemia clementina (nom. ined.)]